MINDILDLSKINHDPKFKLEHRRFSLRKCVKGNAELSLYVDSWELTLMFQMH